jgi:hypothetical protein
LPDDLSNVFNQLVFVGRFGGSRGNRVQYSQLFGAGTLGVQQAVILDDSRDLPAEDIQLVDIIAQ